MKSAIVTFFLAAAIAALAQVAPDPTLEREIFQIRAIDHHSHPPRLVAAGETDEEFDALPCDLLQPAPVPAKVRPENPQFISAWKGLWAYPYNDAAPTHLKELLAKKQQIKREQGDRYSAWVLDQLGSKQSLPTAS